MTSFENKGFKNHNESWWYACEYMMEQWWFQKKQESIGEWYIKKKHGIVSEDCKDIKGTHQRTQEGEWNLETW
jgi:hypothetical protein